MDDGRANAATERLHAEFMSIPRQLRLALARAPFIPNPQSASGLANEAKEVSERALRSTAAVGINGDEAVLLPELLAPGGALDEVLTAVMANVQEEQAREPESEESLSLYAVVLQKLSSFQISRFGTEDLRHASFLADKCIAELGNKGEGEDTAVILNSMRAFRDWLAGILDVLSKAWKQHRVKIDVDLTDWERQQRRHWCYSNAPKMDEKYLTAVESEEWATLFPIPDSAQARQRPYDWFLSPRVACWLHSRLLYFVGVPDQLLVDSMPDLAKPYCNNERWMENLRQCGKRLAARLKKGLLPRPNCTGEEVFLDLLLNKLDPYEDGGCDCDRYHMIPASTRDNLRVVGEFLMKGSDVTQQLYGANYDLDTLDCAWWRQAAWDTYLHPAEWFNSYKPKPFTNDVMISPESRAENAEHAVAVLGKARKALPEEALRNIVSHLDDFDIIRLTCCGKGS